MSILVIGDRNAGKSHFINAIAAPGESQCVTPIDWDYLDGPIRPTQRTSSKPYEVQVDLPSGPKMLLVDVMDTQGEIWQEDGHETFPEDWQEITAVSAASEGIFLLLPPYTDLLKAEEREKPGHGGSRSEWVARFQRWLKFLKRDCPKAQHILICISKADLFEKDIQALAHRFAYQPGGQSVGWHERHQYVLKRHFRPIAKEIQDLSQFKRQNAACSVQCFLTSIHHRSLLELPWIYLASDLEADF